MIRIILIFLIIASTVKGDAQQSNNRISGRVTDEQGQPVAGATVFVTNTTKVTATDTSGKFYFSSLLPGSYSLVIKMLGFSPYIQSFKLDQQNLTITAILKESNTSLNVVNISGNKQIDKKNLSLFIKHFLGETDAALQCTILNPEVLIFHYTHNKDTNLFVARANDMLVIENRALGYKINYLITKFEVDFKKNIILNQGQAYFEELHSTDSRQRRWEAARKANYLSSMQHFFKAIFNHKATDEGFYLYQIPDKVPIDVYKVPRMIGILCVLRNVDSIFRQDHNNLVLISPNKLIKADTILSNYCIVYTGERMNRPLEYERIQLSAMQPLIRKIIIDKQGVSSPAGALVTSGYWANGKVAALMPLDYNY